MKRILQEVKEKYSNEQGSVTSTQLKIVNTLLEKDLDRDALVKSLAMPRTTIYDNLSKLKAKGVIRKYIRRDGKRGRPLVFWKLKKEIKILNEVYKTWENQK